MPASTAGPEPRHDAGGTDADAPPQDWRDQALAAGYLPPPAPSWPIGAPPLPPPGWVPPPPAMVAPNDPVPQSYWVPDALDGQEMIDRGSAAPQRGWRRLLHTVSGGRINPGDSRKDREQDALIATIRYPLSGDFRIAVLSIKGGVGKTTTTLGLGSALAMARSDRVIAVDANPDRGTLAERVLDPSTQSTVRDLLRDSNIHRYADVRNHTRMAISRLEVLASEQDPAVAEVFGDRDYRRTIDILRHYYNVILTDCGTGIMHSAMEGVLDLAHAIVLVTAPAIDAVLSASATLDWLDQHGHSDLVREAHVVFSAAAPASDRMVIDKARAHFEARCRSIHFVPFDQHLAEGADIDFAMLKPATMRAYLGLAGAIAQKFPAAATTTG
ncbi:MinD/ParA family protein [Mycobacterium sp. CBMA226]|nr:MinD/ParA family protein [Mycolicibacterium sp. CBMA 226]